MRHAILFCAFLVLIKISTGCGKQESHAMVYTQADSLLTLTLKLQSRIGSPEIQRLHQFQTEINNDLSVLAGLENADTSLTRYRKLHNGLGQCMQTCNNFHEEAFMLESSLREIMEQSGEKNANLKMLEERLVFETENYNELFMRTDSSLELIRLQAGIFYKLKPEIDKIKEQVQIQ